jgi:mannose-6-phosphate isomerase-like protein (cupin superfamily)
MKVIRAPDFKADLPWDAFRIACMAGISLRLHWTDRPYQWHVNDGEEVLAVLDGIVDMHYRDNNTDDVVTLAAGDIFFASIGTDHAAHPRGEARILVIEKSGSV